MRSTDALCFPPLGKGFEKKPFRQPEISVCPGYLKSWLFKKSIQNIIFSCNREYLWLGFIPKLAAKQKDRGEQTQRWSGSNPNDSPRNSVFTQQLNKSSVNFFFFLFMATPAAYRSSQARGRIGVCSCQPIPQPLQHPIQAAPATYAAACGNTRSSTHWARPGVEAASSRTLCRVLNPVSHNSSSSELLLYVQDAELPDDLGI